VGVKLVATAVVAALVATTPIASGASYLTARQQPDGGFAERGQHSDPALSAWVALGLEAAGQPAGRAAREYLAAQPSTTVSDLALRVLALTALGANVDAAAQRLEKLRRPGGRIGPLVNSTIWSVLALRAAGRPAGVATVRYLLAQQHRTGGWSWAPRGSPDSNDTAAAVQALRSAGVPPGSRALRRAVDYLRRLQNRDGGFALTRGRTSDAQSTAWAIQALLAAGKAPGRAAFGYLERLQQRDGSFRYSTRYAVTPAWVTAQVLPALSRKPFPLR
jgi:hypothetical protein